MIDTTIVCRVYNTMYYDMFLPAPFYQKQTQVDKYDRLQVSYKF